MHASLSSILRCAFNVQICSILCRIRLSRTKIQAYINAELQHLSLARDVSAASELLLELWDIGGTRGDKQLQKLSQDPSKVIENARFLGSVEVPMSNTMAMNRGEPFVTIIIPIL